MPLCHRPTRILFTAPEGVHVLDVRDSGDWVELLSGVDVVCHLAAMVGCRGDGRGPAAVRRAQRPRHRRALGCHGAGGGVPVRAGVVDGGLRRRAVHLRGARRPVTYAPTRRGPGWTTVRQPLPMVRAGLGMGDGGRGCRARPAQQLRREQGGAEHYAAAWARQAAASAISLRYHNVYGPGMPRDTPYSGVAAIFRSAMEAGRAPVVFEDGGQMRDFVHVHDVARANVAAVEAVPGRDKAATRHTTSAPANR